MCTSVIHNGNKTIIGWNLDIIDMEYKVVSEDKRVYIAINDKKEGWIPLFGANINGDFIAMPTCWPYDSKSDPIDNKLYHIINLDIDLLLQNKTFNEIKKIVETNNIYSVPGVTFQAQLTNKEGDVLQITPGQGYNYYKKPKYSIMTNFSPFKGDKEKHPWMGLDRYNVAKKILENANEDFGIKECFELLKETSQEVCPTVVSMVFNVTDNIVYWCEERKWDKIREKKLI